MLDGSTGGGVTKDFSKFAVLRESSRVSAGMQALPNSFCDPSRAAAGSDALAAFLGI